MRIALATSADYPALHPFEQPLLSELERLGVHGAPVIWSDTAARWADYEAVIVRSCWDYHRRHDDFLAWIERVEQAGIPMWNPPAVLRWNSDKRYLRELAKRGIRSVPTRWVERGDRASLSNILDSASWNHAVVKPVVSASAHDTWRTTWATARIDEPRFQELVDRGGVMVQQFLPEVTTLGEWSLIFLGGTYSHAAIKHPKAGDFRVQAEHGGSAELVEPAPKLIDAASRAVELLPAPSLYARVDGCIVDGAFVLMELEAVEPSLFLELEPIAAPRFARAIQQAVQGTR